MHFRKEFSVSEVQLLRLPGEGVSVVVGGPHNVRVRLRNPTAEEIVQGNVRRTLFCSAEESWEPNANVTQIMKDLVNRRVPKGHHIPEGPNGDRYLDGTETLKSNQLPFAFLPDSAQSLINQVHDELADAIRRTVKLLHWRWALPGSHNPFSARIQEDGYSFDGVEWYRLPTTLSMELGVRTPSSSPRSEPKCSKVLYRRLEPTSP
jgi:hypothetical protein